MCTGVLTLPQKHHLLFLAKLQTVQASVFKQSPLYIGFSWTLPKSGIFKWPSKIWKFFFFNTILSFKSN